MDATYQVAHDDLAVTANRGGFGRHSLASTTSRLGVLLDTANRGGGSSRTASVAAGVAATTSNVVALGGRGDLLEGLVKLSRHDEGGVF